MRPSCWISGQGARPGFPNVGVLQLIWCADRVVDGEWVDETLIGPLPRIISLLLECKDRVLVQRYGIWLVKHDATAGLNVTSFAYSPFSGKKTDA